jgi:hypothetical protein
VPNDECSDAIAVHCGDTITGSTAEANNSGGGISRDVFYSYKGNGTPEMVTVSLCGSNYNTYVRILKDCSLTSQIAYNNNSDDCGEYSLQSKLTFVSDGVSTYIIMIEGYYEDDFGDYQMNITCEPHIPPANDNCESVTPTVLTNGTPVTFTGTTVGATMSANEQSLFTYATVWEAVTLTGQCNTLTYNFCGTPFANMISALIAYVSSCSSTQYVMSNSYNASACTDGNYTIRFTNLPAGTYYLPVLADVLLNKAGEYTMTVVSEDCLEPHQPQNPDFPCFQGDGLEGNAENAYGVSSATTFRQADDFKVESGSTFSLKQVVLSIYAPEEIASVDLHILNDASGKPDSTFKTISGIVPTSQQFTGYEYFFCCIRFTDIRRIN